MTELHSKAVDRKYWQGYKPSQAIKTTNVVEQAIQGLLLSASLIFFYEFIKYYFM